MSRFDRNEPVAQRVVNNCACGHKGSAVLKHYDVVRCSKCGKFWWALQPKRNDGVNGAVLVAYPWPGTNLSAAELREKKKEESL